MPFCIVDFAKKDLENTSPTDPLYGAKGKNYGAKGKNS